VYAAIASISQPTPADNHDGEDDARDQSDAQQRVDAVQVDLAVSLRPDPAEEIADLLGPPHSELAA
jgi:hypothetical protein